MSPPALLALLTLLLVLGSSQDIPAIEGGVSKLDDKDVKVVRPEFMDELK